MSIAEAITVVATIALVVLTAVYAWHTRNLVIEMRHTREETIRPAVKVVPEVLGVNFPIARITNVGPGHAIDISGKLTIEVGGEKRWEYEWEQPVLAPGDHRDFIPRVEDSEELTVQRICEEPRVFRMSATYADSAGRPYSANGSADWRVVTEHMWGAGMLRTEDFQRKIESHAEQIAKSLRDVTSSIDGVRVTTWRERRLQAAEWRRELQERRETEEQSTSPDDESKP